ncbi:MAG: hypothetical protein HQM09_01185 [Candidatus Riflebacteria bacterium]|nr:hypothetical protein [Candidatus Riflebacteria bacterium]
MANKRKTAFYLTQGTLTALLTCLWALSGMSAFADPVSLSVRNAAVQQARRAAQTGGEICLSTLLSHDVSANMKGLTKSDSKGIQGNIRYIVGGRNFTSADIDSAEVPFYTLNGLGLSPLLHDGGEWPNSGGDTNQDSGRPSAGVDWAGEFYDLDGNGHYPKAVLRYIGSHCYIFVPPMFFPTLPRGISATEETTPAPKSEWGMYWPDTGSSQRIYFAPASGAPTLDPRFVFGTDKNLARMKLKELADEFDGVIYPKMREFFGSEPDVDQDPKIFILLDDIRDGAGTFRGYFWSNNEFPRTQSASSNEKELLYIDLYPTFLLAPKQGYRTIAHEFTHMICFNEGAYTQNGQLIEQERWLEEGFTQFASYLYDQSHTPNVDEFIKSPDTILVDPRLETWLGSSPFANYGASYLFVFYLMDHYGVNNGPTFMKNLVRDRAHGITALNNALLSFNTTFEQVFSDFAIANFLDKTRKLDQSTLNDGKWGYSVDNDNNTANNIGVNQSLPVKFSEQVILSPQGTARSSNVNPWAADYIQISGNTGNLNLGFDGDDGATFKAAVIKRGPQVDPSVEYIYLNEKQAGNLIIQNYGLGNTYENLVLVPMITSSGNYTKSNYVYSATFSDLKVAIFPNPVFENELHVVVRTNDKFAATPRLQMTYNGEQGYLTMAPLNDSTYITNYDLKVSGEGQIEAFGTNSNGTILSNILKFSAVYYPPKSSGLLSASFASLSVPRGALRTGGLVTLSACSGETSWPGIERVSSTMYVGLPGSQTDEPVQIRFPLTDARKAGLGKLGLFETSASGPIFLGLCDRAGLEAIASISHTAEIFAAVDLTAPVIHGEAEEAGPGRLAIRVDEIGAGIDPDSIRVQYKDMRLPASYDAVNGRVLVKTSSLLDMRADLDVELADKLGNGVKAKVTASVVGSFGFAQAICYPSPARIGTTLRCSFTGGAAGGVFVEAVIRDTAGDDVWDGTLRHQGGGVYEAAWDLRNQNRKPVANGVYYVEFTASTSEGELKERRKLAVMR